MSDAFRAELKKRLAAAALDPSREHEIVEELAQHLEDRRAELLAGGADEAEATAAALQELEAQDILARRLAQVEPRAEPPIVPGANPTRRAADLWHDLRYALRALRQSPGFTAVTLLSLALGIGANTTLFQLVNAIELRKLDVPAPDELMSVHFENRTWSKGSAHGWHPDLAYPLYEDLRARQEAFSDLFAWGDTGFDLSTGGKSRSVEALMVSGSFFDLLGVTPALGRVFHAADDTRRCPAPGVVLSHAYWQRELGGDPEVLGRRLSLDGKKLEIIGVARAGFHGIAAGRSFDVAVPICAEDLFAGEKTRLDRKDAWWISAVGRLKPGWTEARARAHMAALSAPLLEGNAPASYTAADLVKFRAYQLSAKPAATGISDLRRSYSTSLYFLLGTAGLILLIACTNLANLLLARASKREREIAVRLALGASRARLIRQLMAESLLLALAGAGLALLLAQGLGDFLIGYLTRKDARIVVSLAPDWRVLGFTAGLAALTCVLFGLAPALSAARTDVGLVLKATTQSAGGTRRFLLRRALVVAQVALSFVLVASALLFGRSFRNLVGGETGVRTDGVMVLGADLRPLGLDQTLWQETAARLREAVLATPGVNEVASVVIVPLSGSSWNDALRRADDGAEPIVAFFNWVSPGTVKLLELPLLAGRDLAASDHRGAAPAALLNQSAARKLFGEESPLGREVRVDESPGSPAQTWTVVGMVGDSKYARLSEAMSPQIYLAAAQDPNPEPYLQLLVRGDLPPAALGAALERTFAAAAPAALIDHNMLDETISESLTRERLLAALSGGFGLLAALLAAIGLYGVIAYNVARRTHEIGLRMALGADGRKIARLIILESLRLVAYGVGAGIVLALVATRAAAALLHGLAPHDPTTLALAVLVMGAIAAGATFIPARRASRVDPMVALRDE